MADEAAKDDGVVKVEVKCRACKGTGVYTDSQEQEASRGKVCWICSGHGKVILEYFPFTERGVRADVAFVRQDIGPDKDCLVSYDDFLNKGSLVGEVKTVWG